MKDRLSRVQNLLLEALEIEDPGKRSAFLAAACGADLAMLKEVEELIVAQGAARRFLPEMPATDSAKVDLEGAAEALALPRSTATAAITEKEGDWLGRYRLLQKIGEGGCGVVYMAEQTEPVRRRVALKVIKLGMDTKQVIARFEAERQALALMDHPNIAKVHDAGATGTGRPYFVMELVRGVRITDYCDEKKLTTRQRLELFIQVCQAVQHAHQKGIIHRDIKPSNILVTVNDGAAVAKVIDFGIAKATTGEWLTDKTLFTAFEQFIGTPAYVSPEQAEITSVDIDTRSDIYSLGVLLYELLTGQTPFDTKKLLQAGLDEMRRMLREVEPPTPSTRLSTLGAEERTDAANRRGLEAPKLLSLLRGDLDWIVMKCLEKDRARRFETANGLAMDVRRHLANEPVTARQVTKMYRLQKLVRRNKPAFVTGAIVLTLLCAALTASTSLFMREREARRLAVAAKEQETHLRQEADRLREQAEARQRLTEATTAYRRGRMEEADRLVAATSVAPQLTSEYIGIIRRLGHWNARYAHWSQAADRFAVVVRSDLPDEVDARTDYLCYGALLLQLGKPGYERLRQTIVPQYSGTTNPIVAETTIKLALLTSADARLLQALAPLADVVKRLLVQTNNWTNGYGVWYYASLGLWEYRRSNYSAAQQLLEGKAGNAPLTTSLELLRAMTYFQLGNSSRARSELAQARNHMKAGFTESLDLRGGSEWWDWVVDGLLLHEAESLIDDRSALEKAAK